MISISKAIMTEVEVYRLNNFNPHRWYEFALYTRRTGVWPNESYYTTHPLVNMGFYIRSERWGYGDNSGGREIFTLGSVTYDYEGTTCFRERHSKMNESERIQVINIGRNSKVVLLPPDIQRYITEF